MSISPDELRGLGDLPAPALSALAAAAVPIDLPQGALIFQADEPSPGLFIVRSGRVKIVRESPGGREQVLYVVEAGQSFNLVPALDGGPCPASAIAISDVRLLLIGADSLRAAARRSPDLALALLAEAGARLRGLVRLVDDLALHTVYGRLAGLLLDQAAAAAAGAGPPALTHAEIAARLGTVREMVGRGLKTFEQLGLIRVIRGTIELVDRAGLEAQAEQ